MVVASVAHKSVNGGLDFDDLESRRGRYKSFRTYSRTKLMNILFTRELARRLAGTNVTANSLHPGFVASKFATEGDLSWWGRIGMPLDAPVPDLGREGRAHLDLLRVVARDRRT